MTCCHGKEQATAQGGGTRTVVERAKSNPWPWVLIGLSLLEDS